MASRYGGPRAEALLRQSKYFLENSTANRQGKAAPRESKYFLAYFAANKLGTDAASSK